MKPTLARIEIYGGRSKNNLILTTTEESAPDALSPCIAEVFGDEGRLPQKANAALIVAAWNSCVEINPSNPIAAAEAMPKLFEACKAALAALSQTKTLPADVRASKGWLSHAIQEASKE